MITAIVGTYNDSRAGSIRGNGKTMSAVFLAYHAHMEGKKVYSNFYTSFSEMITTNQLVELFKNENLSNVVVILDEVQLSLPNQGVKAKTIKQLLNLFIAQTRKREVDIIITTQRYKNLHKQLRVQCDVILVPLKFHISNGKIKELCYKDTCRKNHVILIYNVMTEEYLPYMLNPVKIGSLYDSNKLVLDEYITQ